MYIKSFKTDNINIDFVPSGWNVIKGDNGFGKTTILKNISLLLLGEPLAHIYNFDNNLNYSEIEMSTNHKLILKDGMFKQHMPENESNIWNRFFSIGIGSIRNLKGNWYENYDTKTGQYFSIFNDVYSFGHLKSWLLKIGNTSRDMPSKTLSQETIDLNKIALQAIIKFMQDFNITRINSDGVYFNNIEMFKLSKSQTHILIIIFEIIRQMYRFCGYDIYNQMLNSNKIDLEGVVLIDDVMDNIQQSKQLELINWLTTHFPNIQFIVTSL